MEIKLYSTAAIRQAEQQRASSDGLCYDLMQQAGRALAKCIQELATSPSLPVTIFCGAGNNGGDGYELAHDLLELGFSNVRCCSYRRPREGTEAYLAYDSFLSISSSVINNLSDLSLIKEDEILVDALLGIGFSGEPKPEIVTWIEYINNFKGRNLIVSVDVPSGLDADSGYCATVAVKADVTLTLLRAKRGLFTCMARDYVGEVKVDDIGVLGVTFAESPVNAYSYQDSCVQAFLPKRLNSSNKSSSGKVVLVGGCAQMPGALKLAAMAALRSGSGLVRVVAHPDSIPLIFAGTPEIMLHPLVCANLADSNALVQWADSMVIGPGLGRSDESRQIYEAFINAPVKKVVDADALYWLSGDVHQLTDAIITPHEMEAARILGENIEYVRQNRYNSAVRLHELTGAVVVLKGAGTIIYDGNSTWVCTDGCSAMAVGGMGDILSGIISALLAVGLKPSDAARVGVGIHGAAGIKASEDGAIGTLPSDLLIWIRKLINGQQ